MADTPTTADCYDWLEELIELSARCAPVDREAIRERVVPGLRNAIQAFGDRSTLRNLLTSVDTQLAKVETDHALIRARLGDVHSTVYALTQVAAAPAPSVPTPVLDAPPAPAVVRWMSETDNALGTVPGGVPLIGGLHVTWARLLAFLLFGLGITSMGFNVPAIVERYTGWDVSGVDFAPPQQQDAAPLRQEDAAPSEAPPK